jgi:hypothetical protein
MAIGEHVTDYSGNDTATHEQHVQDQPAPPAWLPQPSLVSPLGSGEAQPSNKPKASESSSGAATAVHEASGQETGPPTTPDPLAVPEAPGVPTSLTFLEQYKWQIALGLLLVAAAAYWWSTQKKKNPRRRRRVRQ